MSEMPINPLSEQSIKFPQHAEEDFDVNQVTKVMLPLLSKAFELESAAKQVQTTSRLYNQLGQSPEEILKQLKKIEDHFAQLGTVIEGFKNKVCKTRSEIEKNTLKSPADLLSASLEKQEKNKLNWLSRWFRPSKS